MGPLMSQNTVRMTLFSYRCASNFSLIESWSVSTSWTVFLIQACCDKHFFGLFVNIFFLLKHASPYHYIFCKFHMHFSATKNLVGSPHGIVVNVLDCSIVISKFELKSHYFVHFQSNILGEGMDPLIHLCILNCITSILLQGWIWHWITPEGWYAIKHRTQTQNLMSDLCLNLELSELLLF